MGVDKTERALIEAVKKWDGIGTADGTQDLGYQNCSLCVMFRSDDGDCGECPVKKDTGEDGCDGTPYRAFLEVNLERVFVWDRERKAYVDNFRPPLNGVARVSSLACRLARYEKEYLERLLKRHREKLKRKSKAAAKRRAKQDLEMWNSGHAASVKRVARVIKQLTHTIKYIKGEV